MAIKDTIRIVLVQHAEIAEVRLLMRGFVDWQLVRNAADKHLLFEYFGEAFERELAGLPGKYGPPDGALLLAYYDGAPAGCVALRNLGDGSCEMKRLFVGEKFHGLGIGRRLALAIVEEGRRLGYTKMLLDTSWRQKEAQRLYESIGFKECEPYYAMTEEVRNWLVFKELKL
jgi:ribosomal protein S18 acetylase RimI-like enzyme